MNVSVVAGLNVSVPGRPRTSRGGRAAYCPVFDCGRQCGTARLVTVHRLASGRCCLRQPGRGYEMEGFRSSSTITPPCPRDDRALVITDALRQSSGCRPPGSPSARNRGGRGPPESRLCELMECRCRRPLCCRPSCNRDIAFNGDESVTVNTAGVVPLPSITLASRGQ
jgi:hypothetical protein